MSLGQHKNTPWQKLSLGLVSQKLIKNRPIVKVISTRFVSYTLSPLYLLYKPLKRQSNSSFAASSLQQRSLPTPLLCVVGKYVVHCIFFPDTQKLSLSLCLSVFNFRVDKRLNKDKNFYPNLPESVGRS